VSCASTTSPYLKGDYLAVRRHIDVREQRLATFYGVPFTATDAGFRVDLPRARPGWAFSAGRASRRHGHEQPTSPTLRGKYVNEMLLYWTIPPPPPGVPPVAVDGPSRLTVRQVWPHLRNRSAPPATRRWTRSGSPWSSSTTGQYRTTENGQPWLSTLGSVAFRTSPNWGPPCATTSPGRAWSARFTKRWPRAGQRGHRREPTGRQFVQSDTGSISVVDLVGNDSFASSHRCKNVGGEEMLFGRNVISRRTILRARSRANRRRSAPRLGGMPVGTAPRMPTQRRCLCVSASGSLGGIIPSVGSTRTGSGAAWALSELLAPLQDTKPWRRHPGTESCHRLRSRELPAAVLSVRTTATRPCSCRRSIKSLPR
jgi:hypothetical protein